MPMAGHQDHARFCGPEYSPWYLMAGASFRTPTILMAKLPGRTPDAIWQLCHVCLQTCKSLGSGLMSSRYGKLFIFEGLHYMLKSWKIY